MILLETIQTKSKGGYMLQRPICRSFFIMGALATVLVLFAGLAQAQEIDIPYQKFVLDNGLSVIIHEDHKAPIVAFIVWYHVGS